jgi:putative molybdopterin biosynthesis protein
MEPKNGSLLTAADIAGRLSIAKSAVYALAVRGELSHFRVGKLVRFREEDLSQFLERSRVETTSFVHDRPYVRHPQV